MAADDSLSRTRSGRDVLDSPPKQPSLRSRPKSSMHLLAGGKSKPRATPDGADTDDPDSEERQEPQNSPEGEGLDSDEAEGSDLASHPVVQVFEHWGKAANELQIMQAIAPELVAPIQDLMTLMNQMVPQWASAKLSGNSNGANGAMSALGGSAGTPSLGALAGTPQQAAPMMAPPGGGVGGPMMGGGAPSLPGGPMM